MAVEWFCTQCSAKANCKHRDERGKCVYEYDASEYEPKYRWVGEGDPPKQWMACGTVVYRSYADYCD